MAILTIWSKFVRVGQDDEAPIVNADHIEYFNYKRRPQSNMYDVTFHMRSGSVIECYVKREDMSGLLEAVSKAGHTEER